MCYTSPNPFLKINVDFCIAQQHMDDFHTCFRATATVCFHPGDRYQEVPRGHQGV